MNGFGILYRDELLAIVSAGLPSNCVAVYAAMCVFSGNDGFCFPSIDTISKMSGIKKLDTVRKCIKELAAAEFIDIEKAFGEDHRQLPNRYYLSCRREYTLPKLGSVPSLPTPQKREGGDPKSEGVPFPKLEGVSLPDFGSQQITEDNNRLPFIEKIPKEKTYFSEIAQVITVNINTGRKKHHCRGAVNKLDKTVERLLDRGFRAEELIQYSELAAMGNSFTTGDFIRFCEDQRRKK